MLYPEKSKLYTYNLKTIDADIIRGKGSVVPSNSRLKMVYRKYTSSIDVVGPRLNLVFVHGTGMNKGIWHYHINKLYELNSSHFGNQLGTVIAVDCVNHCHSALNNKDALGFIHDWRDLAKDIVKMATEEEADVFLGNPDNINIIIGHSMGGFVSLYTGFLAPDIFCACVPINPVCYTPDGVDGYAKVFQNIVLSWCERGYMKDTFTISNPSQWYTEIEQFFKYKSFFTKFHPTVLQNMILDELNVDISNPQSQVKLNTTVQAQYSTYLTSLICMYHFKKLLKFIEVPVYRILSEKDIALDEAKSYFSEALKPVLVNFDLPNEKHLVNGENPDLVIDILQNILSSELKKARNGEKTYFGDKLTGNFARTMQERIAKHLKTSHL